MSDPSPGGSAPSAPIARVLEEAVSSGHLPGAVWHVEPSEGSPLTGAVGASSLEPEREPATPQTRYDLASVTKAVSTCLITWLSHRRGLLDLDQPLERVLEELAGSPWGGLTPRAALLHVGGLPPWAPLYCLADGPSDAIRAIARIPPPATAGAEVVYSDLGPILLGFALERVHGCGLADLFLREIAQPLDLETIRFGPLADPRRAAPTERGNRKERELADAYPDAPCRGRAWPQELWRGVAHDANARFLGGAAGHAGLFSTAADLARIGREILHPSRTLLVPRDREALLRPRVGPTGRRRCLLGILAEGRTSPAPALGPQAAGHLGYTGTSLFLDPDSGALFVLLTNRVHPRDRPGAPIQEIRRRFHAAARSALARSAA